MDKAEKVTIVKRMSDIKAGANCGLAIKTHFLLLGAVIQRLATVLN